jgi:hypothetical protein
MRIAFRHRLGPDCYPDENKLDSPADSLYALTDILYGMQKLADRYVLLGELRGDLMDITSDARMI